MPFRTNLLRARKKAGITQQQLGDRLGISDKAVSQWERGETVPELERIPFIANELDVTIDSLLDHEPKIDRAQREILNLLDTCLPGERETALRALKVILGRE